MVWYVEHFWGASLINNAVLLIHGDNRYFWHIFYVLRLGCRVSFVGVGPGKNIRSSQQLVFHFVQKNNICKLTSVNVNLYLNRCFASDFHYLSLLYRARIT